MQEFKVLSFNIHKGFGTLGIQQMLRQTRAALREITPDFVFLQEVVGNHQREKFAIEDWPTNAQFEYLADQIWHHHAYGKNAIYDAGHHGNAILSKYPIIDFNNFDISNSKFEQRGLLHAIAEIPESNQRVNLICLHLDLRDKGRMQQFDRVIKRINETVKAGEPLLVCGDFNDWRVKASKLFARELNLVEAFLKQGGKHAKTFPSQMPMLQLDRIYYRELTLTDAERLDDKTWRQLSDHIPLLAYFKWRHRY